MAYYYFSPVYNFIPCVHNQFLQHNWNLNYQTFHGPKDQKLLKKFQQNFSSIQEKEISFKKDLQNQMESLQQVSQDMRGIKKRTKKRRGIDKQKELQSAKKNSESNIINQFFSYFSCRIQSVKIVQKVISSCLGQIEQLQKILSIFYNIMKCMSLQRLKKYINKMTLLNIFARERIEKQIPEIVQKFKSLTFITIDEITEVIRRCCFYFLRNISLISLLSSKRISNLSKKEHLKKRRLLSNIVSGKI